MYSLTPEKTATMQTRRRQLLRELARVNREIARTEVIITQIQMRLKGLGLVLTRAA